MDDRLGLVDCCEAWDRFSNDRAVGIMGMAVKPHVFLPRAVFMIVNKDQWPVNEPGLIYIPQPKGENYAPYCF